MQIKVTAKDIARACRLSANHCPVALATTRVLGQPALFMSVGLEHGYTNEIVTARGRYRVPRRVVEFAVAFDSGHSVKPFTFTLRDG